MKGKVYLRDFENATALAEFYGTSGRIRQLSYDERSVVRSQRLVSGVFIRLKSGLACFFAKEKELYFFYNGKLFTLDETIKSELKISSKSPSFLPLRKNKFTLYSRSKFGEKKPILELKYRPARRELITLFDPCFPYTTPVGEEYDFFLWVHNVLLDPNRREVMINPDSDI